MGFETPRLHQSSRDGEVANTGASYASIRQFESGSRNQQLSTGWEAADMRLIAPDISIFTIGNFDAKETFCSMELIYSGGLVSRVSASLLSKDMGQALGRFNGDIQRVTIGYTTNDDTVMVVFGYYTVTHKCIIDGPGEIMEYVTLDIHRVGRIIDGVVVWDED